MSSNKDKHSTSIMAIIKTLVKKNDDFSQREKQKLSLEKDYKDSAGKLDSLLQNKHDDLYKVVHVYSKVYEHIRACRANISLVKESLTSCKDLLHCKRDELRNLYVVHVEQTKMVELLQKLEHIKDAPQRIESCLSRRHFLRAARLLTEAQKSLSVELNGVAALQGVSTELTVKNAQLGEAVFKELHAQLYSVPCKILFERFSRLDSFRGSSGRGAAGSQQQQQLRKAAASALQRSKGATSVAAQFLINVTEEGEGIMLDDWQTVDLNKTMDEPEQLNAMEKVEAKWNNRASCLITLMESLWLLGKLPSTIERLRLSFSTDLRTLVVRSASQIANRASVGNDPSTLATRRHTRLLCELLDLLLQLFTWVANSHRLLMRKIDSLKLKYPELERDSQLAGYDVSLLWSCVQSELQFLLSAYLQDQNTKSAIRGNNFLVASATHNDFLSGNEQTTNVDLSCFLTKRRQQVLPRFVGVGRRGAENANTDLFSFAASSHSISINSYLREQGHAFRNINDEEAAVVAAAASVKDGSLTINIAGPNNVKGVVNGFSATLVCKPSRTNISVIYSRIEMFLRTVERELVDITLSHPNVNAVDTLQTSAAAQQLDKKEACELRRFMSHFVTQVFLPREEERMRSALLKASKDMHGTSVTVDEKTQNELGLSRPILESVFCISQCLREVGVWLHSLPLNHFAQALLKIPIDLVTQYLETAQRAYRFLGRLDDAVDPTVGSGRLVSAVWARDADIMRLHKSMPHWQRMRAAATALVANGLQDSTVMSSSSCTDTSKSRMNCMSDSFTGSQVKLSGEEQATLWAKESRSLLQNMRQEGLTEQDTMLDKNKLRLVAHLHESAEWLAEQLHNFSAIIHDAASSNSTSRYALNNVNEPDELQSIASLTSEASRVVASSQTELERLASEFQHLADTCLLMLHLESRIICFTRINCLASQGNYFCRIDDMELDEQVNAVLRDLSVLESALSSALQSHKFRYVVEGLGHVIASVLLDSLSDMKRMNDIGVKKMSRNLYSLQAALSSLTLDHEADLIRAKDFFELLHQSPDSVINDVRDHGPKFEECQYVALFDLYRRSRSAGNPEKLIEWRAKLGEVLNTTIV